MKIEFIRKVALLALALVLSGTGSASAQSDKAIYPAGAGPFPSVMFISGCSGFTEDYDDHARALVKAGYAVVYADYLSRLGATNCSDLDGPAQVIEIAKSLMAMSKNPKVDRNRLAVIGWSNGGRIVLNWLGTFPLSYPIGFTKAVMLYPACKDFRKSITYGVPALMLLGAEDTITPAADCNGVQGLFPQGKLRTVTYPGAAHGFDLRGSRPYRLGVARHDARSDSAAWAEIRAFLQ
jgi:dienelactone hydrolase